MKHFVILLLFFSTSTLFAQDLKLIEKDLTRSFHEIGFWHNKIYSSNYDPTFENSLEDANDSFELLLLKYTSSNLQTLNYDFKGLLNNGLTITTSEDGLFRIYSWDTQTGGTMLNINNVFQFRIGKNIYSQILTNNQTQEESNPGCYYDKIYSIISNDKKYYIALSTAILSSNNFYYNVRLFSIENSKLNDSAKLIRTETGMRNQLGYEVDLTSPSNSDVHLPTSAIVYEKKNKKIIIPLILEDGKITTKKIVYHFNGKYFERI